MSRASRPFDRLRLPLLRGRNGTPLGMAPRTLELSEGRRMSLEGEPMEILRRARSMLGDAPVELFAAMVGAPPGSEIALSAPARQPLVVTVTVRHPELSPHAVREFHAHPRGGPDHVKHVEMGLEERGTGRVSEMLSTALEAQQAAGFRYVEADATSSLPVTDRRGPPVTFRGLSRWPLYGFDGKVPAEVRPHLPPELRSLSLLDLYARPGGRATFERAIDATLDSLPPPRRGGATSVRAPLVFDLTEGSRSWCTLRQQVGTLDEFWAHA